MRNTGSNAMPLWKRPHLIFAGISAILVLVVIILLIILFVQPAPSGSSSSGETLGQGYLHTSGAQILDAQNHPGRIAGVSWFGLETATYAPHGLNVRNYKEMLDQIKSLHYNTIRLPFSTQLFDPGSKPTGIDYTLNPDLKDLSGLQIIDKIVDYAGSINLRIILDRHRITADQQSPLWYTQQYPEQRWLDDWKMLAEHYKGNQTVIGADLHNEPQDQACWGCGDSSRDWHQAAEKAGNAILQVNSGWLIFVQGVSCYGQEETTNGGDCYWWGGNLRGVKTTPVSLNVPDHLVYSVHDYPPSLHNHTWFDTADYPRNLSQVWDSYWGYIQKENIAPVWIGEFGTRLEQEKDKQWLSSLVSYLGSGISGINWTFWSWNPDSADTGGILNDDWKTVNQEKLQFLQPIRPPFGGTVASATTPTTQSAHPTTTPATTGSTSLQLSYQNGADAGDQAKIAPWFTFSNTSKDTINLSDVTIRYWFTGDASNGQTEVFNCDYARPGCSVITGKFSPVSPPRSMADTYLEVGFTAAAGSLAPGQDTGEIKLRINKSDYSPYDQKNDYSYTAPTGSYAPSTKITIYYKGALVGGTEPA